MKPKVAVLFGFGINCDHETKAVFDFVFGLPLGPPGGQGGGGSEYELTYFEVADKLPVDVLTARLVKEAKATPRFAAGGAWRTGMRTTGDMWAWINYENGAYASKRLLQAREPLDPELLKSY